MASSVAQAKRGIRDWLRTIPGLREADEVTVRGAPIAPEEFADQQLILGDVTAPQTQAGLGSRAETPTLTCHLTVTRPGPGDDAEDAARDRAFELMGLVETALREDSSAGGAVPPPGQIAVGTSTLEEMPADLDGAAARRAVLSFQLSWTSHI